MISRLWPCAALLLSACAAIPSAPRGTGAADWIRIGNAIDTYGPAEREQAYLQADQAFGRTPTSAAALRLALLVADPRSAHYDVDRALKLLDGVIDDERADSRNRRFARFLSGRLARLAELEGRLVESAAAQRALQERVDALVELEQRLNDEEAEP